MRDIRRLAIVLPLLWLPGCEDAHLPTDVAPATPRSAVSDGMHTGNAHFFFLPPLVAAPRYTGVFDASVSPRVEICVWSGATCTVPLVASYAMNTGPGSETVRRDLSGQHYIVNWHTDQFLLDLSKTYRIRVLASGTELGHADVTLVNNGKDARNLATGGVISLVNGRTLSIKFRIEVGAVGVISPEAGGTATLARGAVALDFPPGAVQEEIGVTATPVPVVTDETDTSILPGTLFEFQPSPLEFTEPVTLTIGYPATLPPGMRAERLAVCKMVDGACRPIQGSRVDPVNRTVAAQITGFSEYGITEWPQILRHRLTDPPGRTGMHLSTASGDVLVVPEEFGREEFPSGNWLDDATWSPDGSQVAYLAFVEHRGCFRGAGDRVEIHVVNADGTGRRTLVGPGCYVAPKWSPAGNELMYTDVEGTGEFVFGYEVLKHSLRVVNANGIGLRTLASGSVDLPAWSADGHQIAYVGRPVTGGDRSIWIMNSDGSNSREVVSNIGVDGVSWSQNGQQLVFTGVVFGGPNIASHGLWIVNADGTGLSRLARGSDIHGASWSPAGEDMIVFNRYDLDENGEENPGVFLIRSDGSGERRLVRGWSIHATWSPDGRRLAFGWGEGSWAIWIINRDGSGLQPLPEPAGSQGSFAYWRP